MRQNCKSSENPFALTMNDFVFYVIYTHERGYNAGSTKQRIAQEAKSELNVETVKGHKFHQTEWHPITDDESYGLASGKFCGICTFDGVKDLISRACLSETCDTMGAITLEYGWMPATSFQSDYWQYSYWGLDYDEIAKKFRGQPEDMVDMINMHQNNVHSECYISAMVLPERIYDIIERVYGKPYDQLNEAESANCKSILQSVYSLEDSLMAYLIDFAKDERDAGDVDESKFNVDFRQQVLPLFSEV